MADAPLSIGDPAPWFAAMEGCDLKPVVFDELAGRFILLFFFGAASQPGVASTLASLEVDGERSLLVGVGADRDDFTQARLPRRAGQTYFLDSDGAAAKRYGLAATDGELRPAAFLLSPALQILEIIRFKEPILFIQQVRLALQQWLREPPREANAPVLLAPRVFDSALCERLIALYDADGGRELGQIESGGRIVERSDVAYRKRRDYYVSDQDTLRACKGLLERRLLPLVYRAFQFPTTRIERYLVGCYDSTTGGYFRAHRDNTAPPVAHRRFALTLPLNDDYEGGRLRFPEFGNREFAVAAGEAIVFSCSLLHEVTPVTLGRRYAFISFLYDEQGQKLREAYAKSQN